MGVEAVVPAAGQGRRMLSRSNKQFLPLCGRPALIWTLEALAAVPEIEGITVLVREEEVDRCRRMVDKYGLARVRAILAGGAERQDSVWCGLKALPPGTKWVVVHDGARPLATPGLIRRVLAVAQAKGAAAAGVPVADTIKEVDPGGRVVRTLARPALRAVQTPQAFAYDLLCEAHRRAQAEGFSGTDDCALVERLGAPVWIVEGELENIKLTTPRDLRLAREILAERLRKGALGQLEGEGREAGWGGGKEAVRVGIGFDAHRLVEGRPLILGGVQIPYCRGLLGHSDADVLLHAVMDALLGAAALGDLGRHFPDTDPQWRGASSLRLLAEVDRLLRAKGYVVQQVDATVIAQEPRLAPYVAEMCRRLAETLRLPLEAVSVKATTTEGLGWTGRGEGMAAQAVALVAQARREDEGCF
ncbi:MAG: 2-C-methyl-D-erythritol 4-phosphate cytidylyltransferase [Bacillota bacterium]|nr:2-C-methyl-D-erythritol 4-phosphate cytidylyltransferase [Bacillota bacterium]